MSLAGRSTKELQAIIASGGGLRVEGSMRSTKDLQAIAASAAASGKRARVVITGMASRPTKELQSIAVLGEGLVSFED